MINIKDSIIKLPAYEVPQKARIKLNQNESPYDIPSEDKKEILRRLKKTNWNRYPQSEPKKLKSALADYTGHPPNGILVGNGSNELILAIMLATCDKGDEITLITPGFAIYPYIGKILNLKINEIPLKDDFSFDVERLVRSSNKSKLIMFASPNNPTGTAIEIADIEKIVRQNDCFVVVDEAYYEFHNRTCLKLLNKFKNLLILRTFSKAFGLAGIRLGYLLGNYKIVKEISKAKLPFSVGISQQIIAEYLLGKKEFVMDTVRKIIYERENMFKALNKIPGISSVPSCANFILFGFKEHSANMVFEEFYKKGILVRKFNHQKLKNMLRVTIGTPEENRTFLENLIQVIRGGNNA
ncbi:MAG: histidinol-phosphate transaminase [candidate division WOR-3 bacterium]